MGQIWRQESSLGRHQQRWRAFPGTEVTVSFADKEYNAVAGPDGKWMVKLDPVPANATPQTITITGSSERKLTDILIGEVWVCGGQSNMKFELRFDPNGGLEVAAANLPSLRLMSCRSRPRCGNRSMEKGVLFEMGGE